MPKDKSKFEGLKSVPPAVVFAAAEEPEVVTSAPTEPAPNASGSLTDSPALRERLRDYVLHRAGGNLTDDILALHIAELVDVIAGKRV